MRGPGTVWLFDLDDTLHDASYASMPGIHQAMGMKFRPTARTARRVG